MPPTWQKAPDLDDTLSVVWKQLSEEVGSMPSLEEVAGISTERLSANAMEAIQMMAKMGDLNPVDPSFWVRLYCLGFVIGVKYNEARK